MKSAVIHVLALALLFALGAGEFDARGVSRHMAEDDAPVSEVSKDMAPSAPTRRADKKNTKFSRGGEARGLGKATIAATPEQSNPCGNSPTFQFQSLHLQVPLRI